MQRNMTLNNIRSEEDKIVDVVQGGCLPWGAYCRLYCSYDFKPRQRNDEALFEITHDIMEYFVKDKVVGFYCQYSYEKRAQKRLFKEWIHTKYIEDGKVNEFKQYLIQSKREDLIWTDYMRYVSDNISFMFFPTEIRSYARDICILQEYFDWKLICMAGEFSCEDEKKESLVFVFPHSKIKHLENDSQTVESYVTSKDYMIMIGMSEWFPTITLQPNPRYISYEQLLEIIKPIIEKHGWKLGNTENPHKKALQCDVNCPECDETQCPHYMKGYNPRVDQTYYKVEVD